MIGVTFTVAKIGATTVAAAAPVLLDVGIEGLEFGRPGCPAILTFPAQVAVLALEERVGSHLQE